MKCDEKKPSCHRCVSTGRKCDGYPDLELKKPPTGSPYLTSHGLTRYRPIVSIPGDAQERDFFYIYQSQTAYDLSGFYESDFWTCRVLQTAHSEPALRHAVIALSALHKWSYIRYSSRTEDPQRMPPFLPYLGPCLYHIPLISIKRC